MYSIEVLLFFNIIPKHIDAFFPSSYVFENSVAVEIWLLHLEPLVNSHFHFFVIVESAASQCCFRGPNKWKSSGARSGL
jgi:hypothetical protein